MKQLYIIGSLRNPQIPVIASAIRKDVPGLVVFDDWYAAGPEADDYWMAYEKLRGHSYAEALKGEAAKNVYAFDKRHLDAADGALLVLPAGKSGHLELGYMAGRGKWAGIYMEDEPDRWDVMYQFADQVFVGLDRLLDYFISGPGMREKCQLAAVGGKSDSTAINSRGTGGGKATAADAIRAKR